MKKFISFMLIMAAGLNLIAQSRIPIPAQYKNQAEKMLNPSMDFENEGNDNDPAFSNFQLPESIIMGNTWYDLQSMAGIQNRFHIYDDGTMAVVYNYGTAFPNFPERGTGYNYFDGNEWGPYPTQRVESERTGWPSYAPFGENGEIFCSHLAGAADEGLLFEKRETKGQGQWSEFLFQGPYNFEDVLYPRIATSGVENSTIFLICLTKPIEPYQGLEGALLYSRSIDGGVTWLPQNFLIPEINSNYYNHFNPDTYEIIAKGDLVAILYGSEWQDLGLLKSTDGGNTFSKTLIWESPYPFWVPGTPTDTFYCVDGAHHLAFDSDGMVHVVFGINRTYADAAGSYWFPLVDGLGYWNESRPTFSNALNALDPYGGPGSELEEDYSLIGWAQDINNNGEWDILGEPGRYYIGISSQPQIAINEEDEILVIYSSVTETYNNGAQDYRHLWARISPNGDFWGPFHDLTSADQWVFNEFVFPSIADNWEANMGGLEICYICQTDNEPGLAVRGDNDPFGENLILFPDVTVGIGENNFNNDDPLELQIYPNPATSFITIKTPQGNPIEETIIYNNLGQKILITKPVYNTVDVSALKPGIYFIEVATKEWRGRTKLIKQ
jgi:hypothetical protein